MKRLLCSLLVVLATGLPVTSVAQMRFEATIDKRKITFDETATLSILMEGSKQTLPSPQLPPLDAFDVFSSGRTQSLQIVNGRAQTTVRYDYVLSPRRAGRFTIGPARVIIDGTEHKTKPIILTVTNARQRPAAPSPPAPDPRVAGQSNRRVFITAELDKDTAYVNEAVTYTFRLYRAERLLASPEYSRPAYPGFWVEELPPQRKYTTSVGGVNYEVTEIRTALFPAGAGVREIAPARLKATIRGRRRSNRNWPFNDNLFGFFSGGEDLHLKTAAVTLTVLPLPKAGKPANWGGLIGNFSISARADVRNVNVGDPITVAVTVQGAGNVKSIPRPGVDSLPDFRTFSAGSSEEISKAGYRVTGKKTFDEVFVPQRPGTYILPAFSLSYFDPGQRAYKVLRTDSISVTVTGAAADFTIPSFRLDPDELSDLAADVRFLKTDGHDLARVRDPGLFGAAFWLGHALPLAGLAVLFGWRRRILREAADPAGRRRRLAYRQALERLNHTDGASGQGPTVDGVSQALLQFYADRYNCPVQGQRRVDMQTTLSADGIGEDVAGAYLELLDLCDRNRYAPADSDAGAGARMLADRAREVLGRIEQGT